MINFLGRGLGRSIRHKVLIIVIAVLVVIAAGIFLFVRMKKPKERTFASGKQNTVELTKMDLTNSVSATGTIESVNTKSVSAQVSDVEVKSVKVSEGDEVKKGQTLLIFDKTDLQSALSEAKENLSDVKEQASNELSSAKRRLSEAESNYQSQKSRLAKSVAEAKKNYQSAKKEAKKETKGITTTSQAEKETTQTQSQSSLEQLKSAYEQAVSEQENTNKQNQSEIQSAKESVTTTESNNKKSIREAEKKVEDARETLEKCSVTAPISGTVTAVGVEKGDIYSGGNLFEISDCADLQISTSIGEYDISQIKKGQKAAILTDATGDNELEGEITYVAVSTGSSSLSTSSSGNAGGSSVSSSMGTSASSSSDSGYTVKIKITDVNENLRIGMTAKCSIILNEAEDVYAVPYDAVHQNEEGKQVIYVADSAGKKEVEVEKGMESDYYVEISGEKLQEGMKVIIPSDAVETDGAPEEEKDFGDADFPDMGNMSQGKGGGPGNGAPSGNFSGSSGGGGFGGGRPGM